MCGIVGFYRPGANEPELLQSMAKAIRHRGPDENGFLVDRGLHFGHQRLSIIDLAGGRQPMVSQGGQTSIVFNGEIYNFRELREALKGRRCFASQSDTEVLLHAYEELGEGMLPYLNGMFAFAIADWHHRKIFLTRDRMGKKPLYYSTQSGALAFASELKALTLCPWLDKKFSKMALVKYFAHEYVPHPWTLHENIFKLDPGHCLTYDMDSGAVEKKRYWNTAYAKTDIPVDEGEALEKLEALLEQSVRYRMIADVPVGVFLSGGLDSSTCLALIRKNFPGQKLQTFSIGFDNKSFDERQYSSLVAERFGTEHIVDTFTPKKMLAVLPDIERMLDDPLADASLLPSYLLCRHAARSVKVAIGGDAADELLSGYPTFLAHRVLPGMAMPGFIHQALTGLCRFLPVDMDNMSWDFKVRQTLKGLRAANPVRNQVWLGAYDTPQLRGLFKAGYLEGIILDDESVYADVHKRWGETKGVQSANRLNDLYLKTYLVDDILLKVDRAAMMNSLEVRSPFLDVHVVEYINSLPACLKLNGRTGKYLLRKLARKHLPAEIIDRPKRGFGIPISHWFRHELRAALRERIDSAPDFLDKSYLMQLYDDHQAGRSDNRKQLFTYFMVHPFITGGVGR